MGRLVKEARKQLGWTQAQLAAELGVSRGQVANWETGVSDVPGSTFLRLLELVGWKIVRIEFP